MLRTAGLSLFLLLAQAAVEQKIPEAALRLATSGEYDAALELFRAELEKDPESSLFNYYVGICLYFMEDRSRARDYLEKAVEEEAPFPQAYYWLGRLLLEEKEFSKAFRVAADGRNRFPRHEKLIFLESHLRDLQPGEELLDPLPSP